MADNSNQHKGDQNNPRNQDAGLFKRLTRLFSGPLVDYNQPAVTRTTARTVTKYKFTTASGKEFKKEEYHNPFSSLQAKVFLNRDKQLRYTDFDQMEYMPEIASALDVYADEITTSSELTSLVHVECHNREIKEIIHTLLYTVLNIESNLFGWARSMCKYGDYFLYLDVDDTLGITNVIPLPVREVERLEGKDPTNPNYVQYYWSGDAQPGVTFENWQLAHFRVLGNDKYVPYGTSVLEPSRRIWRQLTLLEDAMMAYRIVRSPERRVFYIDVGNIPAEDVEQYIEQVKTQMKRNQIVDQDTGRVDLRYNAMSIDEDYYIPVRAGNSSRIETLAGGSFTGDIEDVQYLRDKLFSALKVPKAYLAQSDSMEDKTTLAQKDIRFARTIQRLQRVVISEIEKMCIIHLYTLGYRNADLTNFKLTLNNPSKIAELQELEHLRSRFEIAGVATDGYFSKRWVYKNIFKLDDDEIERMQFEQYTDSKHAAAIESMGTAAGEAATAMAGGGEGGDEDLGGDDLGSDDLGDDSTEESPEEEGPLLAEPGQRNDNGYETVKLDGRRGGARLRSYLASAGESVGSSSDRNLFKGWSGEMKPLSRGIVGESMRSEEKLIRETSNDILNLISDLGKNNED